MSYRVRCSACGKVMTVEDDAAGDTMVCVACGTRLEVPPPAAQVLDAQAALEQGAWDQADLPAIADARVAEGTRANVITPKPAASDPAARWRRILLAVIGGALALIVIAVLLTAWIATGRSSRWSRDGSQENLRNNADLLALKSEAEALAIRGRLEEAHAKYRQLQQLWATRDVRDGLMWDILERAKVDQDRIYTMLLNRMAPAVPDPRPGTALPDGTVIPGAPAAGRGSDPSATTTPDESAPSGQYPANYRGREAPGPQPDAQPNALPNALPNAPPASAPSSGTHTPPPRPLTQPAPATQAGMPPPHLVSDAEVGEAIKRGIEFLIPQFKRGLIERDESLTPIKHAGLDALCVYALLTSGQAMRDPRLDARGEFIKQCLDRLKDLDLRLTLGGPQQPVTYARSLRAAALAVYNRPEDRKVLKEDVDWLVAAAVDGAYTYDDQFTRGRRVAAPVPSPLYSGERVRVRDASGMQNDECRMQNERQPNGTDYPRLNSAFVILHSAFASPLAPALSPKYRGEGVKLLSLWDDSHAAVIPVHGPHDPRTGREMLIVPPGYGTVPPPPLTYPQRSPSRTVPPPGGYGWRELPNPGADAQGSSSPVRFPWDNSNSQFGLLGVWSGAEVGIEVPTRYWKDVERHWTLCQLPGGEWAYKANDSRATLAMTSGGLASLFVTQEWAASPAARENTGRPPLTRALALGLAWMEQADNCVNTPGPATHYFGYDLYGLERVGLASGYKYFGAHDWYRELAAKTVAAQAGDGSWGRGTADATDTLVDTAFTLLFLSRGRHPILMNKLQWDRSAVALVDGSPAPGYWANRPRDVANLTRYASRQLERGINWQVVSLDVESSNWLDAPILYIASHQAPGFSDGDYEKLRQFVEAGGLIFTHADNGAGPFNRWVPKLVERVAPGRKLEALPENHFVYNVLYKLRSPPELQAASNGTRLLLVHSPTDLGAAWQQRNDKLNGDAFRLGVNLFVYAAGKTDWRNRLDAPFVPEPVAEPAGKIAVARLKYAGDWDPEPGGWQRFRRLFEWQTRVSVEHPPVALKDLKFDPKGAGGHRVAHLTGTGACTFTDEEVAAVKAFVQAGGILVVEPCGGSVPFSQTAREGLLDRAFPGVKPAPPPDSHPLLWRTVEQRLSLKARPYVSEAFPDKPSDLAVLRAGEGWVVVSPLDITSGLLGTNTWGIAGYQPDVAAALMHNVLTWSRATQ